MGMFQVIISQLNIHFLVPPLPDKEADNGQMTYLTCRITVSNRTVSLHTQKGHSRLNLRVDFSESDKVYMFSSA